MENQNETKTIHFILGFMLMAAITIAMHFALDRIKSKQAEENLRRHDMNCGYNIQK